MSDTSVQFNAALVDPAGDRTPVPAGGYSAILKSASVETTKAQNGKFISCQFGITAPPEFAGKTVFYNINFLNANPTAQEIGQSKLSALCHAVGVLQIQDVRQLYNIPLGIEVTVSEDNKYNEITAFRRADGQPIVKGMGSAPGAAPGGAAPAWAQPAAPAQQAPQQAAPAYAQQPAPQQPPQQAWTPPAQQQAPAPVQQPWQPPAQQEAPPAQQPWTPPAQQQQQPIPAAQPPAAWQPPGQQPAPQQAPAPQGAVTPPWIKPA